MPCHIPKSRSVSARRSRPLAQRHPPPLPPLVMLDLEKPAERSAHDFLCRATNPRGRLWTVIALRRHGDVLLCVVRWAHSESPEKPFSLAEVSLTEIAVCWRDYRSVKAAREEMERRCSTPTRHEDAA